MRDIHNCYLMHAIKILHKGEQRIKVNFPYNYRTVMLIKKIPGAKWSKTMKAWHIPFEKKEFNLLKTLFPEIEYPKKKQFKTSKAQHCCPNA